MPSEVREPQVQNHWAKRKSAFPNTSLQQQGTIIRSLTSVPLSLPVLTTSVRVICFRTCDHRPLCLLRADRGYLSVTADVQLLFWSSGYTQPSCDWQQLHYYADNNLSSSRDQAPLLSVECSSPPFFSCSLCKHTHQISEVRGGGLEEMRFFTAENFISNFYFYRCV